MSVVGAFVMFALGGSAGMALAATRRVPGWALGVATLVLVPADVWLNLQLPFLGVATDLLAVAFAALALAAPMGGFFRFGKVMEARRAQGGPQTITPATALVLAGTIMSFPLVLGGLLTRLGYSEWLGWSCDGQVASVFRNRSNHNTPTITASCGGSQERFGPVDDAFFALAKPGQHLVKSAGSPRATLDGTQVRMVPRQSDWARDPP